MPKNNKKKAFTLTELLVVVVIIGVLAAVILPKFNKVVETRKTTEAEEIMAAVRTEQEYRCAMDKPYIGDIAKLSQIPQAATKNFTYQLDTNGMLASSRSKSYNLKMPSYADGRVCCEGSECNKLNKDYPKCNELTNRPDFKVATECTAQIAAPVEISCPGTPQTERSCDTGCGTQTRSYECVNGEYVYGEWAPVCVAKPEDDTDPCPGGYSGTQTRSAVCNTSTGQWDWGNWDTNECKCIPTNEYGYIMIEEDCPEGQTGYIYKQRSYETCNYEYVGDSCKKKCSAAERDSCVPSRQQTFTNHSDFSRGGGSITATYTGRWDEDTCTCEESCVYTTGRQMVDYIGAPEYNTVMSTLMHDPVIHGGSSSSSYSDSEKIAAIDRLYNYCIQNLPNQCSSMGISVGQTGTPAQPMCYLCVKEEFQRICYSLEGSSGRGGRGQTNEVEVPCTSPHNAEHTWGDVYVTTVVCGGQ